MSNVVREKALSWGRGPRKRQNFKEPEFDRRMIFLITRKTKKKKNCVFTEGRAQYLCDVFPQLSIKRFTSCHENGSKNGG